MSTNKKFRVQNGLDVTGEVSVGGVTVINADGTVVSDVSDQLVPLQADVAALETAVENIIGTSPETLDTLQEIVAAYEGADGDLQLLVSQTNQSVQDLENSVGAGAALTVTSDPTIINYEEVLGAVYQIATNVDNKIALYQSNNFNSVEFIEQYGVSTNQRLRDNWGQSKMYVTGDALFVGMTEDLGGASPTLAEYNLVPSEVHSDSPVGEYPGMQAYGTNNQYLRNIYADDDYVIACADGGNGWVKIWTRGDFTSQPITLSKPVLNSDYESWGRTVYRANDYIIVGGYRSATVHNLDGSLVKTLGPYLNIGNAGNLGGSGNGNMAMSHYGNMLLIGAPEAQMVQNSQGAALLFDLNDLNVAPTVIASPDAQMQQYYGYSVHIDADYIVIGGPQFYNNGNNGERRGVVTVAPVSNPTSPQLMTGHSHGINDYYKHNFGKHVSVRENTLIVSADGFNGPDASGRGGVLLFDITDLSVSPTLLELPGTGDEYPRVTWVSPAANVTQSTSALIVPSSGVVPAINYLEDKTNDMQAEINALSGTDTSLTTSVAANTAAITANTAAISAEATARQAAIGAIPAPDLSSYATSASVTAGDLALQDQIDAIVGTSPETLDTLQEIVAAFESADGDLQTLMTANSSSISDLDTFVKGDGTSHFYVPDETYWTVNTNGSISAEGTLFMLANPASNSTFGGAIVNSVAVKSSELLTVGEEYTVSFSGGRAIGATNSVWKIIVHGGNLTSSSSIIEEYEFTSYDDHSFTFTSPDDRVYISITTPSGDSPQRGAWVRNLDITSPLSLDTTATQVVPAINELHTLAGLDTSIVGDVATNTQAIANEVVRATAAEAALAADIATESSARSAKGNTQDTNIAANATAISNEVTRATAAEQANTDAIVVEAAARASADSDLSASISAIASGVNTGDLTVTGSATFESGINVGSNGGSIGYDDTSEDIQMMSDVDMSGNLIHNLGTPVASTDAASKSYVDGRISSVIGGSVESLDTIKEVVDAFQNADSDIQSLITANSTSVSANTTAIAAETTRAQGVEASLQSQITAAADTSDLETAIATLDAFVGEGNTEARNYLPAIASNGSSYLGNVGPSTTLTGVGTHGVNIVQSNNSSFSAAGTHTLSGLTAGTQYRFDVDVTAVSAGNGLGGDGFMFFLNDGSSSSAGGPTTLEMLGVSKSGGSKYIHFTPTSDTVTILFYPQNTNCEWTIENMSITIEGDSPVALDTTAQTVAGAVNELAAAVADTSSINAAFQAADSDVTAAFTAADAAITTAFQAADASLQAQIDAGSFDGSAIDQNLVPSVTDTYSLGTPDKVWKDLYIGPGSLYLNGTKILEDNSGTITMYADAGQNLSFGASGGGSIDLNAGDESIQIKSDLVLSVGETISTVGGAATRFGGSVNMQTHKIENVGAPTADLDVVTKLYVDTLVAAGTVSGDRIFDANVVVEGNLTVSGTTTTVNSETISLADNIIDLNSNLTSGAPSEHAGIRVLRGDESAVQVRWNETSDHWEVYNGSAWTKIALNTDDLAEGSTNQYFTEVRARGCVSADDNSCINYNEATGKFSLDVAETEAAITPDSAKDADKLDGQHGSFYRINVYDANGALVN